MHRNGIPSGNSKYRFVQKDISSQKNCTEQNHPVLSSPFKEYTLTCYSASIPMLTKMRGHHSQCWSLVSTCHGHPSCPMIRPIKDHHQSLDPCACSTSEYPSFFPCVASSWLEEHRNASLSNSCQKGVSEQEGGCAHQCQLGQP